MFHRRLNQSFSLNSAEAMRRLRDWRPTTRIRWQSCKWRTGSRSWQFL